MWKISEFCRSKILGILDLYGVNSGVIHIPTPYGVSRDPLYPPSKRLFSFDFWFYFGIRLTVFMEVVMGSSWGVLRRIYQKMCFLSWRMASLDVSQKIYIDEIRACV